jgi:hypothetical protein
MLYTGFNEILENTAEIINNNKKIQSILKALDRTQLTNKCTYPKQSVQTLSTLKWLE